MIARFVPRVHPLGFLGDDVDRLFGRMLNGFPGVHAGSESLRAFPAVDVREDEENFYAEAELPGVKMDDVDVSVVGNELTLKGERKQDEEAKGNYHRQERIVGSFTRVFQLPVDIDTQKVEATLSDGVLRITLPKAATARPRQISVKTE